MSSKIFLKIVQLDTLMCICLSDAVAYLGFHFGGGGSKFFWKSGAFAWREAPCNAWQSHAFARGVRGHMLPHENFKKWCNLVRFREYFAKILSKK